MLRRACHVRGGTGDRQHVPSTRGATPPHTRLAAHHRREKGQLYGSVLFEAAVLGFVASVLGVVLGSLLMWGMCVSDIMQEGMRFNFSWQAAVIPILFGIVVTVLASLGSARSATAVTPLEALRPIELTDNRRSSLTRAIIGILMVVVGIAMVVFPSGRYRPPMAARMRAAINSR